MKSILVAEDHRDLADMFRLALETLDVHVDVAWDGASAVTLAQRNLPDLALLDIGLPDIDGFEVCRRLRALPGGADTRIVALTTWATMDDRRRGAAAGFDEHWAKPIGVDLLLQLVRQQLQLQPVH